MKDVSLCLSLDKNPPGTIVKSYFIRLHHHQSFSITSIYAAAILHQSLAELNPPTAPFKTALFSPHCQGPSLHPSPAQYVSTLSQRSPNESRQPISARTGAKRAYNQAKRQVAKAEERWEFILISEITMR